MITLYHGSNVEINQICLEKCSRIKISDVVFI